ncbi:MAG: DUF4118 domain-containing protein [Candidatus Polarisedimenticolia bacterium]
MLARARAEQSAAGRGRLKIFFGYAPGVGKTYTMLEAALARLRDKVDVVVGWVETHGRQETEALAHGLERLPPRQVEYRGVVLQEMDLDAALQRRPALVLVDELAHTNAPGSRHVRRWQDVQELLGAGIDVYSTLNVQHLESFNDIVAQITGVTVRETVPDSVLEMASDVELVDLTPEDLLQRLREGKVYFPEQAQRAIQSFFQKGNLLALRELALQRTAERVDAQMNTWMREQGIDRAWPTRERVLVAVGPSPRSMDLVRAAYRTATRLRAPWMALSVETPDFHRLTEQDRSRVGAHLAFAERLGAQTMVVAGENLADALLTMARKHNVTRIVLGKPGRRRWRDWLRGSMLERVAARSGPIDVLVTSAEAEPSGRPVKAPSPAPPGRMREYVWAAVTVSLSTALCWLVLPFLTLADQAMIYLLGVLFVASRFSRGPALAASLASVAALDFFFVLPYFTFAVSDIRYVITFAVMLLTGVLVAHLTWRVRQQADSASQREQRTAVLYMMSRSFAFRSGAADIAEAAARHVEVLYETEACVLVPDAGGKLVVRGGEAARITGSERSMAVARWVLEHGQPAGHGTDTLPDADGMFFPLSGRRGTMGVLALALGKAAPPLAPSQRQLLEVFVNQAALALERALLAEEAERAQVATETERMRSALLSSVSHDLRTPLAAVTGAATSLLQEEPHLSPRDRRELLETIREEADRLNRIVRNLLEITRLESGTLAIRKEWYPLEEVVGSTLARLEPHLSGRDVRVDLPETLLQAPLDPVLAELVLLNLLENVAKHTPAGTPVEISASATDDEVQVEVKDRGPGIPAGEEEKIFERFYRSPGSERIAGAGLGLAVCRAAVAAHGGRIWAANREGGGMVFSFTLPLEGTPPDVPDEAPT